MACTFFVSSTCSNLTLCNFTEYTTKLLQVCCVLFKLSSLGTLLQSKDVFIFIQEQCTLCGFTFPIAEVILEENQISCTWIVFQLKTLLLKFTFQFNSYCVHCSKCQDTGMLCLHSGHKAIKYFGAIGQVLILMKAAFENHETCGKFVSFNCLGRAYFGALLLHPVLGVLQQSACFSCCEFPNCVEFNSSDIVLSIMLVKSCGLCNGACTFNMCMCLLSI